MVACDHFQPHSTLALCSTCTFLTPDMLLAPFLIALLLGTNCTALCYHASLAVCGIALQPNIMQLCIMRACMSVLTHETATHVAEAGNIRVDTYRVH